MTLEMKQGFSAPEGTYLDRAFIAVWICFFFFWGIMPLLFPPPPVLFRAVLPQVIPLLLIGSIVFFSNRNIDRKTRFGLKWNGPFPWKLVFSFFLFLYVFTILLTAAVKRIADFFSFTLPPQQAVEYMLQAGIPGRIVILFLAIVVAPVTEELLFRHIFYSKLAHHIHSGAAACITALLFAVLHGNILQGPSLFFMGLILQSAYCRTGTILVPMAIHALFNAVSAFLILAIQLQ